MTGHALTVLVGVLVLIAAGDGANLRARQGRHRP